MKKSALEEALALQLRAVGLPEPAREHRFAPPRRWRFDFAWPDRMLAVGVRVLDLFSGIGGFSLGLERAGMQTVAFCEIDPFCRKVLRKHWPDVPIYEDVTELTVERLKADRILADTIGITSPIRGNDKADAGDGAGGRDHAGGCRKNDRRQLGAGTHDADGSDGGPAQSIDLVCGGYPCQPFSHAGKRQGEGDDRHLWPEMHRIIEAVRPRWVLAENVAGHISMGLDTVLSDLEGSGYAWWTFVIPACAVDARHRRDRVWIVAHDEKPAERAGLCTSEPAEKRRGRSGNGSSAVYVADTDQQPKQFRKHGSRETGNGSAAPARSLDAGDEGLRSGRAQEWLPEPPVGRVAHGIPGRVDRLRSLGNAVVPQVVEVIGRAIMECDR